MCKGVSLKKYILIDFDGVIRHWQGSTIVNTEKRLGLSVGALFSVAFSESLLLPTITGQQTHANWVKKVREQLSSKFDEAIGEELVEAWEKTTATIDYKFLNTIRLISPFSKLVLITNATDKLTQDIRDSSLSGSFDFVINSSDVLAAKPASKFFTRTLELLGCDSSECVFIDDTVKNVQSAQALGIQSLHHKSVDKTLEFIKTNCT